MTFLVYLRILRNRYILKPIDQLAVLFLTANELFLRHKCVKVLLKTWENHQAQQNQIIEVAKDNYDCYPPPRLITSGSSYN